MEAIMAKGESEKTTLEEFASEDWPLYKLQQVVSKYGARVAAERPEAAKQLYLMVDGCRLYYILDRNAAPIPDYKLVKLKNKLRSPLQKAADKVAGKDS